MCVVSPPVPPNASGFASLPFLWRSLGGENGTLPETNEKLHLPGEAGPQKEVSSSKNINFQGRAVSFREGNPSNYSYRML